jgi:glyoxylate utilization-related uncharacterized protein
MKVTRIEDAKPYDAKGHFGMVGLRLQGADAGVCDFATMGLSHFLPGGGAQSSASPIEKLYFVVSGEICILTQDGETILRAGDSCRLAAGEERSIVNKTNAPASMLVVLPTT